MFLVVAVEGETAESWVKNGICASEVRRQKKRSSDFYVVFTLFLPVVLVSNDTYLKVQSYVVYMYTHVHIGVIREGAVEMRRQSRRGEDNQKHLNKKHYPVVG